MSTLKNRDYIVKSNKDITEKHGGLLIHSHKKIDVDVVIPEWLPKLLNGDLKEYQEWFTKHGHSEIVSIYLYERFKVWIRYCYGDYDKVNGWIDITAWDYGDEIAVLDPVNDLEPNEIEFENDDFTYKVKLSFVESL